MSAAPPLYRVPCPRCHGTGVESRRYARCMLCDGSKLITSREAPSSSRTQPVRRGRQPRPGAVTELARACQRLADSLRRARP